MAEVWALLCQVLQHLRRDELRGELQVAELLELVGYELEQGVRAVHMKPGYLRPQGDEGPQPGVLGDHVPLLANQRVLEDLAVGEVAEDLQQDLMREGEWKAKN